MDPTYQLLGAMLGLVPRAKTGRMSKQKAKLETMPECREGKEELTEGARTIDMQARLPISSQPNAHTVVNATPATPINIGTTEKQQHVGLVQPLVTPVYPAPSLVSPKMALWPDMNEKSPVVDKMGDAASLPDKRYKLSPTAAMGAGWKDGVDEWKTPSVWILVMQWVRRNVLVEGVDLERFRRDDMPYLDKLVRDLWKRTRVPSRYRKAKGKEALIKMARKVIRSLFVSPIDLPYQIGHWYVEGEWKGMGLFATRQVCTQTIADEFATVERNNCELVWSEAIHEGYDSIYTGHWSETKEEARSCWYQKLHLLSGKGNVPEGHIGFTAQFAVFGRLMFANHHEKAPFYFKSFKPTTPTNVADRFKGKLTIDVHTENYIYDLRAGQQILIHYDFDLTFGDKKASAQIEAELELCVAMDVVPQQDESPKADRRMTGEEEAEMVMSEVMVEKGRPEDADEFVPGGRKVKRKATGKSKRNGRDIGSQNWAKQTVIGKAARKDGRRRIANGSH